MANLKDGRRLADLNQFQLARLTGVPRTRLSLAENGDISLRPEEISKIEEVLRQNLATRAQEIGNLLSQNRGLSTA
jgi:transcriptional regulator with XRE-family HTH domain